MTGTIHCEYYWKPNGWCLLLCFLVCYRHKAACQQYQFHNQELGIQNISSGYGINQLEYQIFGGHLCGYCAECSFYEQITWERCKGVSLYVKCLACAWKRNNLHILIVPNASVSIHKPIHHLHTSHQFKNAFAIQSHLDGNIYKSCPYIQILSSHTVLCTKKFEICKRGTVESSANVAHS